MQYLVAAMELIERHPIAPLFVSFLFFVPLILLHLLRRQARLQIKLWLLLPGMLWGLFGGYKLLSQPTIASQVIEIWFVLPALFVASVNALICFGLELRRDTASPV